MHDIVRTLIHCIPVFLALPIVYWLLKLSMKPHVRCGKQPDTDGGATLPKKRDCLEQPRAAASIMLGTVLTLIIAWLYLAFAHHPPH